MSAVVYLLCAATSVACAGLLLWNWRKTGARLLLWSGLCFVGLAVDNITLFLDTNVVHHIDLSLYRKLGTVAGLSLLLYGMIWDMR